MALMASQSSQLLHFYVWLECSGFSPSSERSDERNFGLYFTVFYSGSILVFSPRKKVTRAFPSTDKKRLSGEELHHLQKVFKDTVDQSKGQMTLRHKSFNTGLQKYKNVFSVQFMMILIVFYLKKFKKAQLLVLFHDILYDCPTYAYLINHWNRCHYLKFIKK